MTKLSGNYHLLLFCVIPILFASCSLLGKKKNPAFYDKGIKINGVRWATRNLDEPGTFAPKPENAGKYYQWNSKKHWPANDKPYWLSSIPDNKDWDKANDPSPVGWRIPDPEDIKKLSDTSKVQHSSISQNNIPGLKCTDKRSGKSIFLPYSGHRNLKNGRRHESEAGRYWSSQKYKNHHTEMDAYVHYLYISSPDMIFLSYQGTSLGFTIRCVSK